MGNKILVVDDLEQNRVMLKDVLAYYGYDPILAADGTECLDIAEKQRPDLILMDIMMPGMDGLTAARLLKENPGTADIKIIAITSFAPGDTMQQAEQAGFVDMIQKPLNFRKLPDIIGRHLT